MELREYWNIIRRRWWLPVAVTAVALVASTVVGVRGAAVEVAGAHSRMQHRSVAGAA